MLAILVYALYALPSLHPTVAHRNDLAQHGRQRHRRVIGGQFIGVNGSTSAQASSTRRRPKQAGYLMWDLADLDSTSDSSIASSTFNSTSSMSSTSASTSTSLSLAKISTAPRPMAVIEIQVGSGVAENHPATYFSNAPTTSSPPPVTTTTTAESTNTGSSGDQGEWLSAHNEARRQYQAPDLVWDDGMMWKAKGNAELCTHGHTNTGENIAWGPGMTPGKTVAAWMSEAPLYNWGAPGYQDPASHFTQVIWVSSQRVGCYVVNCPDGGQQATCEYDPIGNYVNAGMFQANVKPKT